VTKAIDNVNKIIVPELLKQVMEQLWASLQDCIIIIIIIIIIIVVVVFVF
jgi:hypothetical protein